jgi:stress response protein YsnF
MDNALVTELRSMTAAALTATMAAELANWHEATKCVSDISDRADRVLRQLTLTEHELRGDGECRLRSADGNAHSG